MENWIEMSIVGGVGDVILRAEAFKEIKEAMTDCKTACHALTHNDFAVQYLAVYPYIDFVYRYPFDAETSSRNAEILSKLSNRENYFGEASIDNFNPSIPEFNFTYLVGEKTNGPIVIFHQQGSEFSNYWITNFYKKHDKSYPSLVWNKIAKVLIDEYNATIIILGSEDELKHTQVFDSEHIVNMLGKTDIRDFLGYIRSADLIIGVDSAVKSVSLAMKKPTIVWVHDYEDKQRDETFLDPYRNADYCKIIQSDDIIEVFDDTMSYVEKLLK